MVVRNLDAVWRTARSAQNSGHMMIWEANPLVLAGIRETVRVAREGGRIDATQLAAAAPPPTQP